MSKRTPPANSASPGGADGEKTPTEKAAVRFPLDDHPPAARGLEALSGLCRQQQLQARKSAGPPPDRPGVGRASGGQEEPTAPELPALEAAPCAPLMGRPGAVRSPAGEWDELQRQRERAPLDPARYRALAALAEAHGDPDRGALMQEIARALEGEGGIEAEAPRLTLSQEDWQAILRFGLRSVAFDVFAIAGRVLCAAEAEPAPELGAGRPFTMGRGAGSRATGEALLAAVRILGLRAPDVSMSSAQSPPLRSVNTLPPQILVGRMAVKEEPLPSAHLRFFAGRALACFHPDLAAPRLLSAQQLELRLRQLAMAVADRGPVPEAVLDLARQVPAKGRGRLHDLLEMLHRDGVTATSLRQSARFCVNRAGLVVAGSVEAAVAALRAKRGGSAELEDLLAFAVSGPYYETRFGRQPAFAP
jgi:hypothetical protein